MKIGIKRRRFGLTAIAGLAHALSTIIIGMFFSPCIEIEVYYFSASAIGWKGIAIVSVTYFVITVLGMVILVYFVLRGVQKLRWHFLEQHEKLITAFVLILLGISGFLIE